MCIVSKRLVLKNWPISSYKFYLIVTGVLTLFDCELDRTTAFLSNASRWLSHCSQHVVFFVQNCWNSV